MARKQAHAEPNDASTRPPSRLRERVLRWASVIWCVGAVIANAFWRTLEWTPYLLVAGLVIVASIVRHRALVRRGGAGLDLVGALLLGVAYFTTPVFVLVFGANALLDRSAPERHLTVVTSKSVILGYRLFLRSWRPGEETVSLSVARIVFFGRAEVGAPAIVTTRAGALGWEWVPSFEVARGS